MVITKSLSFDSAHMLSAYEGKCNNLHGHTYHVVVEIRIPDDELSGHMVMDYNDIKKTFDVVDHAIIFSGVGIRDNDEEALLQWAKLYSKAYYILPDDCKCTAEDMANHFAQVLRHKIVSNQCTVIIHLSETETADAIGVAK